MICNTEGMNSRYLDLLNCDKRYLVLYGGAGSGKSYFVAQQYIPKLMANPDMKLLVVRKTGLTNRDTTFDVLKTIINTSYIQDKNGNMISLSESRFFDINETYMTIKGKNGSKVIFRGIKDDKEREKVKSIQGITDIWIEEASELEEADFNQLDIRMRGKGRKKHMILTFNPIDVNHWLKKVFIDSDEKKDDSLVIKTTYKDNGFLDDAYIKLLESYKRTDPYYYDVYCLGNWGVLGNTVFDANAINNRIRELPSSIARGFFKYDYDGLHITNIKWINDVNGYITIYAKPNINLSYAIGGDTAGEGSDYLVGQVHDQNGFQVATLRQQMDSDLWTKQMYCLGKYYNNALLAIEVNFDSYPIQELQRLGYHHMYIREVNDTALDKHKQSYGFRTDSWTRNAILNHLIEIVRDHTEFFNDRLTLEEMLTFVRNEKGRMEAKSGSHDDLVMADAIAFEGLSQVKIKKPKPKKVLDRFDDDEEFPKKKTYEEYWG